ncbi:MAG TPA: hypothetical protein VGM84_17745 [Steroidobacteraceae bacterium]|jgi:hypothetical protein
MHSKWGTAALVYCALIGCTAVPTDPIERLDPGTADTVTVLPNPVELVTQTPISGGDPFAYVAPFETDQQGRRATYLWVSVPQNDGPTQAPRLLCDNQRMSLQPVSGNLAELKLSQPPYKSPAPWTSQFYFVLPEDGAQCLRSAQAIAVEIKPISGETQHFAASGKDLLPLQRFGGTQSPLRREAAGPGPAAGSN